MNNDLSSFSFEQSLIEPLVLLIKTKYGIEFDKKLIQINLPKCLAKDYLANVVLYHELGHFIDLDYKISEALSYILVYNYKAGLYKPLEQNEIEQFFPYISDASLSETDKQFFVMRHLGEYFSDVFAAQYIGKCSNYYLDYITNNSTNYSGSHPSTTNRIKLVDDFIDSKPNFLMSLLLDATKTITTSKYLSIRSQKINSKDLMRLLPIEINNKDQLSSLYIKGWELWLNYNQEFEKHNSMSYKLKPSKRYEVINNLIEKSISNFVVKENWTKFEKLCT